MRLVFSLSHGALLLSSDLNVDLKQDVSCLHLSKWSAAVTLAQTECFFMFPLKSQHSEAWDNCCACAFI